MRSLILCGLLAAASLTVSGAAFAHGDHPHPTCKPGYILNDDHKCVKKS